VRWVLLLLLLLLLVVVVVMVGGGVEIEEGEREVTVDSTP